ncbi:MAG TPA: 4a-hydroxytetrahydrobiopterin dehydratase [Solirubrobacteraceae bacterium]
MRSSHTGWRRERDSLVREIEFRDFSDALAFLERIASSVEDHLRRPDMCILSYNRVRLTIGNPHHAGLTAAEIRLAEKVNAVIDPNSPESKATRRVSP